MKVLANEQAFQSIYIDPHAEEWSERIVFLEPFFDTLPPAEMVFKTLRLEDKSGVVVSGPKASLIKLKEHISNADARDAIGKSSDEEIIRYLRELAQEKGLTIDFQRTADEARNDAKAQSLGFTKVGDVYVSPKGDRAVTSIEGKLYGMSASDFQLRGIPKFASILDDSWGETDRRFNFDDPYYIPKGMKKVEAARWYIKARRISKPDNTLKVIAGLASQSENTVSVLARFKPKFEKLGLDLWHDEKESEFVGVTTIANYEQGVYPERVAYFDLSNKDFRKTEQSPEVDKLLNELIEVLGGES